MSAARALIGMAAVAAAMYWGDPASGGRRRARLRDQLTRARHKLDDAVQVTARDSGQRLQGVMAQTARRFYADRVGDDVLAERVRARLGRCVSHPGAVEVLAHEGTVSLSGPVLASEHACVLREIRRVAGVEAVEDRLLVHESGEHVPALQGGRPRARRFELLQESWSPSARLLVGTLGAGLLLFGMRRTGAACLASLAGGGALLARATSNVPLARMARPLRNFPLTIHRGMQVRAPIDRVFDTLAHFENFPQFMRNVREVRLNPDGSSRWTVAGPAGSSVRWHSTTTHFEPQRLLAWRSLPHSEVEHSGSIRFEPSEDGAGTRLEIRMNYQPPAGAVGHLFAKMFGADPRKELEEDLVRLKTYLETGRAPRDAAAAKASAATTKARSAPVGDVRSRGNGGVTTQTASSTGTSPLG